ncbi:GNAT family N-acetyltransferase [Pseudotabrizicola sp. L79]|uniref:GNAT family N-acetyltransferase n=1 Tax=Pseudotabrizicola sp. L79 TaxID=3118402 RepID=UPI002F93D928
MTRKPVTIHRATPPHLPEVHRMLIALAAHHGDQATITPDALRRIALQGPAARLLVAMLDDSPQRHPVGYALLVLRPDLITGGQGCAIEHLFVQAPLRHQGIGRALIDGARALARDEGCTGLTIGTHPENDAAILGYRAMGLAELPLPGPRFSVELA